MKTALNERQMIQLAAAGDTDAFRDLVLNYQSLVRGVLLRLTKSNISLSEDLAQEVFLLVFKRLNSFRFESSFSTWLYRISYNVFVDETRRRGLHFLSQEDNVASVVDTQMDSSERLDLRDQLIRALKLLKNQERVAIIMTSIEGLTQKEAADILGLSLGTLKSHVLRGKENLRQILISEGLEIIL